MDNRFTAKAVFRPYAFCEVATVSAHAPQPLAMPTRAVLLERLQSLCSSADDDF